MVEMVVMLAMFSLVAGIVLASFPSFSGRINLQHSSQQLALALRRAQNMAFAVRQVSTPGGRVIPPAYGIYLDRATPNSFIIFADLHDSGGISDGRYRAADDVVVESVRFSPGVSLGEIVSNLSGGNQRQEVISVSFSVPEARMSIANAALAVGESAEIFLTSSRSAAFRKSVVVRTSGQIYAH